MYGRSLATSIALAGCSFTLTAPASSGDDMIPEGVPVTLTDDTAADFTANAGLTDAVIAARGVIEPAAFVLDGLEARAFAGNHVGDASTYEDVVDDVGAQIGFAFRQVPADFSLTSANRPRGLGITSTDNYTILYSGEILLPAGPVTMAADADDRVVVQVALDGVTFGQGLFSHNAPASLALQVPASGWYPIRAAFGQQGGMSRWRLDVTPMGGAKISIDGQRLRRRVTAGDGLIANAFDLKGMLIPSGETAVATINENYGLGGPGHDLPLLAIDKFTMRFAGQIQIDANGPYTFSADVGSERGDIWRIWIDGVLVANTWPPTADRLTAALDMSPGWHDVLVDYADDTTVSTVQLRMSGPGIPDGPIDPQRLRPAVAFGLTAPFVAFLSYPLVDATSTAAGVLQIPLPLVAPTGATIASVDYGFGIANQRLSDLIVDIVDCHGATTLPQLTTPSVYDYYAADASCAGSPVVPASPWQWRITDTVPGNDTVMPASLYNPVLVATYWGGTRMPFAPTFELVSAPKPTPGAIGFGKVSLTAALRGATLMFEMRAGADPAELASASWVPVADDTVPALTASEWVQYRLAVTSDGWHLASVDKVEITYVVPGE